MWQSAYRCIQVIFFIASCLLKKTEPKTCGNSYWIEVISVYSSPPIMIMHQHGHHHYTHQFVIGALSGMTDPEEQQVSISSINAQKVLATSYIRLMQSVSRAKSEVMVATTSRKGERLERPKSVLSNIMKLLCKSCIRMADLPFFPFRSFHSPISLALEMLSKTAYLSIAHQGYRWHTYELSSAPPQKDPQFNHSTPPPKKKNPRLDR